MRMLVVSALALGAMTTAVMAEPVKLTDGQMDGVTAGVLDNVNLLDLDLAVLPQVNVPVTANTALAIGVLAENIAAFAAAAVDSANQAGSSQ